MQELFDEVREACSPATWSRGVELVRADAVSGDRADETEVVLRVAGPGGLVAPTVTLYPDDVEWECSCAGREDPCEHVAASVIALRRARKQGRDLPAPARSAGRVGYRFRSGPGGRLEFAREIVTGDGVHPLETTLEAIASGRVAGPGVAASAADLEVEHALGTRRGGVLPREAMPRLLEALSRCDDVQLDGEPVRASAERVGPVVRVEDTDGGFLLRVVKDPAITRHFANGVVMCGDSLHAVGPSGLTGREAEDLIEGRRYPFDAAAELVGELLPSLESRLRVDVASRRLPRRVQETPPRVTIETERRGDALSVLPLLVYGDPPTARVDAGRLVSLGGTVPIRDLAAERRATDHLQRSLGLAPGRRVELTGEDALELASQLEAWRGGLRGEDHREFTRASPLEATWHIDGERFDLHFESAPAEGSDAGARRVSAEGVLGAWRRGESLVPLVGGGFAPLPADWLARHGQRVADLLEARRRDGSLPTCALPELAALCDDLDEPRPPAFERLAPLLDDFAGLPEATLPADLAAELRPYQRRGVDWLCFLRGAGLGALLADDMGLGKTLQTLCALNGRCLVVAPTSLLHNWAEEAGRFRPGLRIAVYHGPGRRLDPEADLTLTSYALLRLDAAALSEVEWATVVLDEAHAIKNPDSQSARAAFGLRARWRVALTGTPVENRLDELWSQLHFLNPGLLGGRAAFRERVARPIADGDADAAAHLRRRLRPFLLRRLKREVAPELPPRSDVVLHCVLDENERAVYDAIHAATRRDVVSRLRTGGDVMAALEALLRLRQAACHSGLVPGQTADSSSKVALLCDRLEEAVEDGHKALVFSQWTTLLDRIEPHLRALSIGFSRLDGSTRDRGGVVGAFQSDSGPPVMLVSLKAGGVGLNLTAADHIFLLDPWWNPAVEDQAADRAHRIGQSRPVLVHRLVAERTVEERILALQERKRSLAEVAMGEADQAAALTRDELLELLD